MGRPSPHDEPEFDERLSGLVDEYFDRREAGEPLTPEQFIDEHADVADQLRPYLAGLALADRVRVVSAGNDAGEDLPRETQLPRIEGYDAIEELGRGGMGVVYKALQVATKRTVVLKVMLSGPFASPAARRRFSREIELAARLEHPGIVSVLESGEVAGQPYYAMQYVAGRRLDHWLASAQPTAEDTLRLMVELCEAVEYAHAHGVIHRDLKPANVLIDDDGRPYILDFGLAKAIDHSATAEASQTSVSIQGQVLGTLFYLSPEQARGDSHEIDERTDVYALGVILFEALTGTLPFDTAGRPSQVIERILDSEPHAPSQLSSKVDGELETIILKSLEKEKERRYQSARELADDLNRYLAGDPVRARRPSSLYVLRKKLRKHRSIAATGLTLAALALAVVLARSAATARDVNKARKEAMLCLCHLESEDPTRTLAAAKALYEQHGGLIDAQLVWAQAQFRNASTRASGILFLERRLESPRPPWPLMQLAAEANRRVGNIDRARELESREPKAACTAEEWYVRSLATLDVSRALRFTRQAIELDPKHRLAWRRLAWLQMTNGEPASAIASADRLLALGEDVDEWTVFKGRALAQQGRFREAIELYTRAGLHRSDAILYRAHAYRRLHEYEKAVADYTTLMERQSPAIDAWLPYQRATPLWILGRTEEALEDYRLVRERLGHPFYSDARRVIILRELNRGAEADQVLAAALRDVKNPSWLRRVFLCLAGEITPGQLVAAAARDNREQLCEAYYYAGEVCLLANRREDARRWFAACVDTGVQFDVDTVMLTPMNEFELAQWRLSTVCPTSQPADHHP